MNCMCPVVFELKNAVLHNNQVWLPGYTQASSHITIDVLSAGAYGPFITGSKPEMPMLPMLTEFFKYLDTLNGFKYYIM